jgi:hypothetical protein
MSASLVIGAVIAAVSLCLKNLKEEALIMWQINFQRTESGFLHSSWQGSEPDTVICMLDPPRNALPLESYQTAQLNVVKLYRLIHDAGTFVVGLQEDFWKEGEKQGLNSDCGELPETYLKEGGLGIIYALSGVKPQPVIARLENDDSFREYKELEPAAIDFMSSAAPFFQSIVAAFKTERQRYYSSALAEFMALVAEFRIGQSIELNDYSQQVREVAGSLGLDLAVPEYQGLFLLARAAQLERTTVNEDAVKEERDRLAMAIRAAARPERLAPRSTWEFYRYTLSNRYIEDDRAEAQVAQIDETLRAAIVSKPSEEIKAKAAALVRERCLTDMRIAREGEDKSDLLGGHGDMVSNLLELGTILGIDVTGYPALTDYIQHTHAFRQMGAMSRGALARSVNDALTSLEREIVRLLANTEIEQTLVKWELAIAVIESLGRYHLVHDENLRSVYMNLNLFDLCETLASVGATLPRDWRARAQALDEGVVIVRDFFDLTILRGKNLASTMISAMKERAETKGLLYCDGYLNMTLSRWFEGHDVSYSFVVPRW